VHIAVIALPFLSIINCRGKFQNMFPYVFLVFWTMFENISLLQPVSYKVVF
jgi:hypothetical protein